MNEADRAGYTPVHVCVLQGTPAILQILLEHGANSNQLTCDGFSPLLIAVTLTDLLATRLLLDHGADPNYSLGRSLRSMSVDLDEPGLWNLACHLTSGTPLLAALKPHSSDTELFHALIQSGANICQEGPVLMRKEECDEFISDWTPARGWDTQILTPIQLVISYFSKAGGQFSVDNSSKLLETVLEAMRSKAGDIPQIWLDGSVSGVCTTDLPSDWSQNYQDSGRLWRSPLSAIKFLMEHGANLNVRGNGNLGLLHVICTYCREDGSDVVEIQQMIRAFVKKGAYVDGRDSSRRTPLHNAAVFCAPAIEALIDNGADCQSYDVNHRTPLDYACGGYSERTYGTRPANVRILLNHSNTPITQDQVASVCRGIGGTMRWEEDEVKGIVRGIMAEMIAKTKAHKHLDLRESLQVAVIAASSVALEAICDVSIPWQNLSHQDQHGKTALIHAAQHPDAWRTSLVLQCISGSYHAHGMYWYTRRDVSKLNLGPPLAQFSRVERNVPCSDDDSLKTLDLAALTQEKEDFEQHRSQNKPPVAKVTREGLAQCLNMRDNHGWTALHYAAHAGDEEKVRLLTKVPALDVGNRKGCCVPSPLQLAHRSENSQCVRLIEAAIQHHEENATVPGHAKDANKRIDVLLGQIERVRAGRRMTLSSIVKRMEVRVVVAFSIFMWVWYRSRGDMANKGSEEKQ